MSKVIVYEGVCFVADRCRTLGKAKFIAMHLGQYWLDKDEDVRRKMLAEVWSKIEPKKTK